jgi:hypothetical protein
MKRLPVDCGGNYSEALPYATTRVEQFDALRFPQRGQAAMSRVLLAWELGSGYGHYPALECVAAELARMGHSLCLAAPQPAAARAWFEPVVLETYGIPRIDEERHRPPAESFPDVLARAGYTTQDALTRLVAEWKALLERTRIDFLVAEHAPGALLAARILRIPTLAMGTGFVVPPSYSPLPRLRQPDSNPGPDAYRTPDSDNRSDAESRASMTAREQAMLRGFNDVLEKYAAAPLGKLGELFNQNKPALFTYAELDPYRGDRPGAAYLGVTHRARTATGDAPDLPWPAKGVGRLFAYLRPDWAPLPLFADALSASGHSCVLHVPRASDALCDRLASPSVTVSTERLELAEELATCDLIAGHGGHALSGAALLNGCPLLLLPMQLEQSLTAARVDAMGAGLMVDAAKGRAGFDEALTRLLGEDSFMDNACAFAEANAPLAQDQLAKLLTAAFGE